MLCLRQSCKVHPKKDKERWFMENKKSFGAYICQRRKELGLTQKEFAQKLFVPDSGVSKWERGRQ